MICPVCKAQNSNTAKFCIVCGAALNSGTKVCPNGHIYDSSLSKCPYCPSPQLEELMGETKTFTDNPFGTDPNKTKITSQNEKQSSDPKRTIIVGADNIDGAIGTLPGRKLIGWLVTFTWNKNGEDYKVYEGRNLIGSGPTSDIVINDPAVSSNHCLLLYRGNKLKLKDELSTNGTFVNGKEIDEIEINDNDIIRIGTTELKFRKI
jgi:hypothetical protein